MLSTAKKRTAHISPQAKYKKCCCTKRRKQLLTFPALDNWRRRARKTGLFASEWVFGGDTLFRQPCRQAWSYILEMFSKGVLQNTYCKQIRLFSKLRSSQDVVVLFQNSTAYVNAMVWSSVLPFACKKQRIALRIFLFSLDCLVFQPKGTRFSVQFFSLQNGRRHWSLCSNDVVRSTSGSPAIKRPV